jgi:hypothetical protein
MYKFQCSNSNALEKAFFDNLGKIMKILDSNFFQKLFSITLTSTGRHVKIV